MDYQGIVCRGSYALGSACGRCERCASERDRINGVNKNESAMMASSHPREARDRAVIMSAVVRAMDRKEFRDVLRLLDERADFRHGREFFSDVLTEVAYHVLMTDRALHADESKMIDKMMENFRTLDLLKPATPA